MLSLYLLQHKGFSDQTNHQLHQLWTVAVVHLQYFRIIFLLLPTVTTVFTAWVTCVEDPSSMFQTCLHLNFLSRHTFIKAYLYHDTKVSRSVGITLWKSSVYGKFNYIKRTSALSEKRAIICETVKVSAIAIALIE